MDSRGLKMYAVMAYRQGWSKPRFVWSEGPGTMLIFRKKSAAVKKAREMADPNKPGGRHVFGIGWEDSTHNRPKTIDVEWIVAPVWTETMFTQHGEGIVWERNHG